MAFACILSIYRPFICPRHDPGRKDWGPRGAWTKRTARSFGSKGVQR